MGISSSTSYLLMVDRDSHKVGVFRGSRGNWTNLYYWDCTNGAPSTPTVSGVFTVGIKGYYFDSGSADVSGTHNFTEIIFSTPYFAIKTEVLWTED